MRNAFHACFIGALLLTAYQKVLVQIVALGVAIFSQLPLYICIMHTKSMSITHVERMVPAFVCTEPQITNSL